MDAEEQEQLNRMVADVQAAMAHRDVDAFLRWVAPDVDFIPLLAGVEGGGSWAGHAGIRRWLDGLFEAWEGYEPKFAVSEKVAERAYVFAVDVSLQGRGSGLAVERFVYQSVEFDQEWRATWWRFFDRLGDARDAATKRASSRS